MNRSPAVILYDANGVALAVADGVAIPADTRGLLSMGVDGAGAARRILVDTAGNLRTRQLDGTPAHTSVAANLASVTLLAANTARKGFSIINDSTVATTLYVAFAASATATTFYRKLFAGDSMVFPEGELPNYTGIVTGIWTVATGSARITEFT